MAQEPIRPELWELVKSTLAPAREAGRAYIDSGRYVPKVELLKYKENDQGWPQVVKSRILSNNDGPPDWTRLFSQKAGALSYVLIDTVPELARAIQQVVELCKVDQTLGVGLSFLWQELDDKPERQNLYVEIGFRQIVENILARAEALDIEDEDDLLDLYLQIERGRFSSTLSGDVIVPLVLTDLEVTESVQLVDDLWLEQLDEPMQRARAMDWQFPDQVSPWVAAAATHAIVKRNATFENTAWPPNLRNGERRPPVPLDDFDRFVECLQIVTGIKSGYAQILVRPRGWVEDGWQHDLPPLWQAQTLRAYPEDMNKHGWLRRKKPISSAEVGEAVTMLPRLQQSPKNVRLAARRCRRTAFRHDLEDEIIDATIGIEALLGKDRDELTHRMSQRAAVALTGEYPPNAVYTLLKQVYGQRSMIVHGKTPKNPTVKLGDHTFQANHMAILLLRLLLRNYLLSEEPWTPDSLDELILKRMERPGGYGPADSD
ncbi:HEPN domain-containing protein [Kocuria rosea]|uniref:HEPN domain-containing protein n=1 Tax=Kocuria rosea TaxID=1275 RepID=UPI00232DD0F1|nr:HEPN domain-containing protein [Kocuria rosea]